MSVLFFNTFLFCKLHNGCPTIPGRSQLGATNSIVRNIELTFLTLMSALVPFSFVLHNAKGAGYSQTRMNLSFMIPFAVATCFSLDTKNFPKLHPFLAFVILGIIGGISADSYFPILLGVIGGTVWVSIPPGPKRDAPRKKKGRIHEFFLGDSLGTVFGALIFLPVIYLMYINSK